MQTPPDPLPPPAKRKKRHRQAREPSQKPLEDAAGTSERARSASTADDYSVNPLYKEPAAGTGAGHSLQSSRIARLAKLRGYARANSPRAAPALAPVPHVEMVTVVRVLLTRL